MAALLFDIETAPLPDAAGYLEPATAPANYKDPEKIASYIAEEQAKQLSKCALDLDLCRVIAIGVWCPDEAAPLDIDLCPDETEERAALQLFWHILRTFPQADLVGFNVIGFDLPVLMRRSLYLGLKYPKLVLNKYRPGRVVDIQQELSHQGLLKYRSQDFYCKRFGITVDDPVTEGAQIPTLAEAGEWGTIAAHCRADLYRLHGLAEKLGILQPKPAVELPDLDTVL